MSMEKQKLYKEIDTLPEELTNQVINFIEYLKLSYRLWITWKHRNKKQKRFKRKITKRIRWYKIK